MINNQKNLPEFLANLKSELRLTNLQLAKRIDVSSQIILEIDEQKQELDHITLGIYRKLITLKDWDRNYLYEPFIPKSFQKNLIEGFAGFVTNLMAERQLSLEDIAKLGSPSTAFVAQICDRQIHPDNVSIFLIKKLLESEGKWSKKKIDVYYSRPIIESQFASFEVRRFQEIVLELRTRILQINQGELGQQLGVSAGTISAWEKGKTNPDSIKVEHFRALANLKGWTVEYLINYIYGQENQKESYESIFSRAKSLSPLLQIQLAKQLLEVGESGLIYNSLEKFSRLLNSYIKTKNLSVEEASKKFRIKPVPRLDSILKRQELPTNMDLLRLISVPDLLNENGDRFSYEELKTMVFGFSELDQ